MESETFTDPRDGKVYKTVKIGEQVWMAENLNYDGSGSCYEDDEDNAEEYGRLYDLETAREACPPGWHLPSDEEWDTLVNFAGGKEVAGKKLKAKSGWDDDDGESGNGTDDFGFSALPGGIYDGDYDYVGDYGYWWIAVDSDNTDAWAYSRYMYCGSEDVDRDNGFYFYKFSVRCVQDDDEYKAKKAAEEAAKEAALEKTKKSTFTDPRDGKTYKIVKIGDQVWMAENLNYNASDSRRYGEGDRVVIGYDDDEEEITKELSNREIEENGVKYGRLYDWDTAMDVSPPGWHLPSEEEWQTLVDFAGGNEIAGKKLKATTGWYNYDGGEPKGNGTDDYGFSALPGGYHFSDDGFYRGSKYGGWWSTGESESEVGSSDACLLEMSSDNEYVSVIEESKGFLFSVRCVRGDQDPEIVRKRKEAAEKRNDDDDFDSDDEENDDDEDEKS